MHIPPPTSFRNAPREPVSGVNVSAIVPRLHLLHFFVLLPPTIPLSRETTVPLRESVIPRTHFPFDCTDVPFRNPQRVTPASRFYLLAVYLPHARPWTSLVSQSRVRLRFPLHPIARAPHSRSVSGASFAVVKSRSTTAYQYSGVLAEVAESEAHTCKPEPPPHILPALSFPKPMA